jgi:hypothetical protein
MTNLSPAALAVWTQYCGIVEDHGPPRLGLAAALRAAADCLWVDKPDGANGVYETHRAQLLAIAAELESQ